MILDIKKNFVEIECCKCGVIFAVSQELKDNFLVTKQAFYCPNGHSQSYVKSTEEKLREEITKKNIEINALERQLKNCSKRKK